MGGIIEAAKGFIPDTFFGVEIDSYELGKQCLCDVMIVADIFQGCRIGEEISRKTSKFFGDIQLFLVALSYWKNPPITRGH